MTTNTTDHRHVIVPCTDPELMADADEDGVSFWAKCVLCEAAGLPAYSKVLNWAFWDVAWQRRNWGEIRETALPMGNVQDDH